MQMAKEYGCVEYYWGVHTHLSEVTNLKSTLSEAKPQVEVAQKHTNYEVLMMPKELVGMINLDHPALIMHPTTGWHVVSYTLRYVLLNFVKMSDGHPLIAEALQSDISMPTHLIILNTPKAERLVGMMNKNLPAFLLNVLKEQGLPDDFINNLLKNSCEATMLAKMYQCKWGPDNQVLTTEEEVSCAKKTRHLREPPGSRMSLACFCRTHGLRRGTQLQRPYSTSMSQDCTRLFMTVMRALGTITAPRFLQGLHPGQCTGRPTLCLVWLI